MDHEQFDRVRFFDIPSQMPEIIKNKRGQAIATFSILHPTISVELLPNNDNSGLDYNITIRFNLQTSIYNFQSTQKSKFTNPLFFYSIVLQFIYADDMNYVAEPESDPSGAFTVTDGSSKATEVQGSLEASDKGQGGSIRVHWTRGSTCTVEQKLRTWSLTVSEQRKNNQYFAHEWYWRGLQCKVNQLSPDHLQSVTRNITVSRRVPQEDLKAANDTEKQDQLFRFQFQLQCHVGELGHGLRNHLHISFPGICRQSDCSDQMFHKKKNHGKFIGQRDWSDILLGMPSSKAIGSLPTTKTRSLKVEEAKLEKEYQDGGLGYNSLKLQTAGNREDMDVTTKAVPSEDTVSEQPNQTNVFSSEETDSSGSQRHFRRASIASLLRKKG
ncbi:hypothetical protein AWENTII_007310 [Aspergillus wentii]